MARVRGRLNANKLARKIIATEKNLNRVLTEPLESGVRTMCGMLAVFTEPGTESSRRDYAGNIGGQISDLFSPASLYEKLKASNPAHAGAFWNYYKTRNFTAMKKLLNKSVGGKFAGLAIRAGVPKPIHQAARTTKKGGVSKRVDQRAIVTNPQKLRNYIKTRQKQIGTAAAGYMAAAKSVRGKKVSIRNIPKWKNVGAHRKVSSKGRVIFRKRVSGERASVYNDVDYVRNAITRQKRRAAERIARGKMIKAFRIALKKSMKREFKKKK
tara:strand:- start:79 stop:885 length:807 start_codon:yes stop_codon:yes gene_type:complete